MRLVRGAAAVLLIACLAGCGTSKYSARRHAVNAYFDRIDQAETSLLEARGQIQLALGRFSVAKPSPAEARQVRFVHSTIAATLAKVRAIVPPPAAGKVHRDLIRLLILEEAVASDLVLTTTYVPRFQAIMRPLTRADATLIRDLRTAGTGSPAPGTTAAPPASSASAPPPVSLGAALKPFSRAFSRYCGVVETAAAGLDRLLPPLELRAGLLVQRRALHRSATLCSEIVPALGRKDVKSANAAIHTFFVAAEQTRLVDAPRAATAGLRAYNARLADIDSLTTAVTQDRAELVRTVG